MNPHFVHYFQIMTNTNDKVRKLSLDTNLKDTLSLARRKNWGSEEHVVARKTIRSKLTDVVNVKCLPFITLRHKKNEYK